MRKPYGGCAHLIQQLYILFLHLPCDGIAHGRPVLMLAAALKYVIFSVQTEALIGIYAEIAETRVVFNAVAQFTADIQLCAHLVKIRIFSAVPEADGRHNYILSGQAIGNNITLGIQHKQFYLPLSAEKHFGLNHTAVPLNGRSYFYRRCTIGTKCKIVVRSQNHIHVPIYAAVERKVGALWIHPSVWRIICRYNKHVLIFQIVGDIGGKCRIAALMPADYRAVYEHLSLGIYRVEQKNAPAALLHILAPHSEYD